MTARGFSLIELLVACALLVAVGGAVAAMAAPMRGLFERSMARADIDGGRRAALEMLAAELREAGSDASVATAGVRLPAVLPPVWLTADLDSDAFATPAGAVRITRIPYFAAQAALRSDAAPGQNVLLLDTSARCLGGPPACGFQPGTSALILGDSSGASITVANAGNGFVILQDPLSSAFAAGAVVSEVSRVTYGSRPGLAGARRLVRVTSGGAEQPVLDGVVEFRVAADSDDVSRIRQVTVIVRLEAAAPFRGPVGHLFRRAGTATSVRHWLPDSEIRLAIALRNPAAAP